MSAGVAVIVVTVEIWPHGVESQKRTLGTAKITNDGTGTPESGNYKFELRGGVLGREDLAERVWVSERITRFPRLQRGVWDLVWSCLEAVRTLTKPYNRPPQ